MPRSGALVALVVSFAGCTGTDAGLLTVTGDAALGVHQLVIGLRVQGGTQMDQITAPATDAGPLKLPATVSFTVPSDVKGYLLVHVDGMNGTTRVAAGDGYSSQAIKSGSVTSVAVTLAPASGTLGADMATGN